MNSNKNDADSGASLLNVEFAVMLEKMEMEAYEKWFADASIFKPDLYKWGALWECWKARAALNKPCRGASLSDAGLCGMTLIGWEFRTLHNENTAKPGWSAWERVLPRNDNTSTAEDMMREIEGYIADGYKYQIRDLYAKPHNNELTGRTTGPD